MKIVKKKLCDLRHPERNLRLHPEKQLVEFERSVAMFGQIRPLVVDENNVVLAGNGLFETLLRMGATEADCYVVEGLAEQQKKKLMLADNRIFDLGVDDMASFDSFVLELKDDLDVPGFDEDMLKSLVMAADEAAALLTGYGTIPPERAEDIRATGERYMAREEAAARAAQEVTPAEAPPGPGPSDTQSIPAEVREDAQYGEPYKADSQDLRYILCPKCSERIWL